MKICVEIQHPSHVHHFKYMIRELQKNGHHVKICAVDKDISLQLLDKYQFNYKVIGSNTKKGLLRKFRLLFEAEYKMLKIAKMFNPDLFLGRGSLVSAHVSTILNKPYIASCDSDCFMFSDLLTFPFTDAIYVPSLYKKNTNSKKIVRIDGYKELAYLHPNYFKPNPTVLDELGVSFNEKYIILRFVAWDAHHDIGHSGIQNKIDFVKCLENYATVFISSETHLPEELIKYKLPITPSKIHDALYYSSLLVCDSQTMTTESALLGTPAIRCNSFVGNNDMSNFIELENKYGLIFNYRNQEEALAKSIELIQKPNLKQEWIKKRDHLLQEKINVTAFMIWFVENYPESFTTMKENPNFQSKFKIE
jgi:predicted glycosyltransferase